MDIKKIILVFVIAISPLNYVKADTIDFWHVSYNKIKIREYNQLVAIETLVLKLDSIEDNDSITVNYFRDISCNCLAFLVLEDENQTTTLTKLRKGTFVPLTFALKELINYKNRTNKNAIEIFYTESAMRNPKDKVLLFRIKLE